MKSIITFVYVKYTTRINEQQFNRNVHSVVK